MLYGRIASTKFRLFFCFCFPIFPNESQLKTTWLSCGFSQISLQLGGLWPNISSSSFFISFDAWWNKILLPLLIFIFYFPNSLPLLLPCLIGLQKEHQRQRNTLEKGLNNQKDCSIIGIIISSLIPESSKWNPLLFTLSLTLTWNLNYLLPLFNFSKSFLSIYKEKKLLEHRDFKEGDIFLLISTKCI